MGNQFVEAVATALIRNLDYTLKTDLVSSGMNAIELERTSNSEQGQHLIMFNLDSDNPLEYIVAQPKELNEIEKSQKYSLIQIAVNGEITKVIDSIGIKGL